MKRLSLGIVILFVALLPGISFAAGSAGAGQTGGTIFVGYDGAHLSYKEFVNGNVLDKDTGWQNGGYAELRYDEKYAFIRVNFDGVGSGSATYTGALQNGTPLTMSTKELIYKTELDAGYKAANFGRATLAPYLGIGYRSWDRGADNLPDYKEKYTWWYGALGANLACRAADRLLIGIDAAALWPISPKMKTDIAGLVDEAEFNIRSRLGFRIEVPSSYEIYKTKSYNFLGFVTPYYERWYVGASDTVILTQGGVPVAAAFEPKSHTELYGFKVGVGLNF